ncbi:hypothetical protein [Polyangium sorediatum]|uniref:Lipoprotein n=1 Tax=Polyangium sorediatum TaxID=889274 RepID=A0ABT6P1T3_9BACT|nr:hypothetical protein [Polyangium sorediatum]MDI1434571.1 hypothetical protein [Polyangium sorediatum]
MLRFSTIAVAIVLVGCGGSSAPVAEEPAPVVVAARPAPAPVPEPVPPAPVPPPPPAEKPVVPVLERAEPQGAPLSAPLAGSVLVWVDAPFYLAAMEDAPRLQLAKLDARKDHVAEAVPMRVVAAKGAFVEVEPLFLDGAQNDVTNCAWFHLRSQFDVERLRLFVKREDLAPVVTTKFTASYPDGSKIEVLPGAPIVPLADGRSLVGFTFAWLPVVLPAAAIGHAYVTPPKETRETFEPKFALHAKDVGFAETRVPLRIWLMAPLAATVEPKGAQVGFPLSGPCGSATVLAAKAEVRAYEAPGPGPSGGVGFGFGGVLGVERWYLAAGTALAAETGHVVTKVRREINVPKPAAGAKEVCIERSAFLSSPYLGAPKVDRVEGGKLRLCAPTRVVKHEPAKRFLGGGARLEAR